MDEIWKSVNGFEGLYEVSNKGNVRSLDRIVKYKDGRTARLKGKTLKPRTNNDGYLQIQLSRGDKPKTVKLHRLVAEAFMPNPDRLSEVNHKDEDKTNNNVLNLEWCSHKYNSRYGTRGGRIAQKHGKPLTAYVPGEDSPAFNFESMTEAAKHFEVSSETIRQALLYGWKCRGYILKTQ